MRFRFRFRRFAMALLALTLQSAVPAWASSCSVSDLWNGIEKGFAGGIDLYKNHSDCFTYFPDYEFWIISGLIAHGEAADSSIKQACSAVKSGYDGIKNGLKWTNQQKSNLDSWVTAANDASKYAELSAENQSKLAGFNDKYESFSAKYKEYIGDITDALEYLHYAACACVVAEDSGGVEISQVAGSCIADAACFLFLSRRQLLRWIFRSAACGALYVSG